MKTVKVNEVPTNAQLIDVREADEFTEVRASGAKNMPLSDFASHSENINPDEDVYLICRSGGRSAQAGEYLEKARGFDNIVNVDGGTIAWVEADLPHERG